jgi:hypothetical protein
MNDAASPQRVMVALVSAPTGDERLYCWWECIAPREDEDDLDDDLVENDGL